MSFGERLSGRLRPQAPQAFRNKVTKLPESLGMLKQRVPLWSVCFVIGLLGGWAYAARNSSGTYSLPAGNPVVSGTTITSTWANTTLNDIKTELTNSLDRQGRGTMLAPLQIVSGTAAAPGLTGAAEPSSGLYRAAAGDWRFSVLTVPVIKWTTALVTSLVPLTVTGRTTTTNLTVTGTSEALAVVSGTANLRGLSATGNGSGAGVNAFGGTASGRGVSASGGAPNGVGVYGEGAGTGAGVTAQGGASAGAGVSATAGTGGIGVSALGDGASPGVNATGGATSGSGLIGTGGAPNGNGVIGNGTGIGYGLVGVGGATGAGLRSHAGTDATGATRQTGVLVDNGDISMVGTANPDTTTAITNALTPKNITKAWASIAIGAASAITVTDGFNITSAAATNVGGACGNNTVEITFASAFSSGTSFAVVTGATASLCKPYVRSQTSTTVSIALDGPSPVGTGSTSCLAGGCGVNTYDWLNRNFTIIAIGAQ